MRKNKNLWALVTLLIAGLTIKVVLSQSKEISLGHVIHQLKSASPLWLTLAVISMAGYIVFEALAVLFILKDAGYGVNPMQALLYSGSDVYFSAITPSATGGQPASGYFMSITGIPTAVITATLVLNLTMYNLSVLAIGLAGLVLCPGLFYGFDMLSKGLIIFGFVALLLLTVCFFVLLKNGEILRSIGSHIIDFLEKTNLSRRPNKLRRKLNKVVEEYGLCAASIAGKKRLVFRTFLLNLGQRISQISVTLMVYMAVGSKEGVSGLRLWFVQAYSQIGSNCLPIPGGMGAADYLMLDGFQTMFDPEFAYSLQIVSRGLSFYVCTLVSGVICICGYGTYKLRREVYKRRRD